MPFANANSEGVPNQINGRESDDVVWLCVVVTPTPLSPILLIDFSPFLWWCYYIG